MSFASLKWHVRMGKADKAAITVVADSVDSENGWSCSSTGYSFIQFRFESGVNFTITDRRKAGGLHSNLRQVVMAFTTSWCGIYRKDNPES